MIDKQLLTQEIEKDLEDTDLFLVDLSVSPDNRIVVEIDSRRGVDIEDCTRLTQQIESAFDRDVEDYELEVGSAGLTSPFKVKGQYEKNIGNEIEVLTRDGRKLTGTLQSVGRRRGIHHDRKGKGERGRKETPRDRGPQRGNERGRHPDRALSPQLQISRRGVLSNQRINQQKHTTQNG